jgi:hypothetical protein
MDFSAIIEFLQRFETGRVIDYLKSLDLNTMLHNPWLLGGIFLLTIAALVLRWRLLLVTLFTVSGLTGLIVYTLDQGKTTGTVGTESIVVFVMIGAVIVLVAIYFLFIKNE